MRFCKYLGKSKTCNRKMSSISFYYGYSMSDTQFFQHRTLDWKSYFTMRQCIFKARMIKPFDQC